MAIFPPLITFLIGLIVSAIVIFIATKLFGEKEGFGTAMLAAFIGAVIYAIAYFIFGSLIGAIIGGIAWLIALGKLYKIGWVKAFIVALVIWLIAVLIGILLPTASGPL
jgi:hypothetical protein